ncbi:MAG: right-handed parallel beta-helix repeat-containing protein [Candidatus Lokiarchaeota archaeon]|nr:right-handed parallel beta-helix repeat-containing protein [Candidatus Lokiarchaeota archaeon]
MKNKLSTVAIILSLVAILAVIGFTVMTLGSRISSLPSSSSPLNDGNHDNIYYCDSDDNLRSAIDEINNRSGLIIIINNITLKDTIEIDGGGEYVIEGAGRVSIILGHNFSGFVVSSARSCTFRDLTIDGSAINTTYLSMITIEDSFMLVSALIENMYFMGGGTPINGISITSDNTCIRDCVFSGCNNGISTAYNSYCKIVGNRFYDNGYLAISLSSSHSIVENNLISYCTIGMWISTADYNSIADNVIQYFSSSGIYISNVADENLITGNNIKYNRGNGDIYGINCASGNRNSIIGNLIASVNPYSGTSYGLRLGSISNYNFITGNVMYYNQANVLNEGAGNTIQDNYYL